MTVGEKTYFEMQLDSTIRETEKLLKKLKAVKLDWTERRKGRCLGKVGFSGQDFGGGSPENQKPSGAYRPSQGGAIDPESHCRIGSRGSRIHRTGLALYQAAHFAATEGEIVP